MSLYLSLHLIYLLDNMDWNIKRMFGIGVTPACPLADSSTIFIDTTDSSYQLDPPPTQFLSYGSGNYSILTPCI